LLHLKRNLEVIKITDITLSKYQDHEDALLIKSSALINLGNFEDALKCINKTLAKDPNNLKALIIKSDTLHKMNKIKEALKITDHILV